MKAHAQNVLVVAVEGRRALLNLIGIDFVAVAGA